MDSTRHAWDAHDAAQNHHGHVHAPASRHDAGHHLLQVEDLSVGFRMYEPGRVLLRGAPTGVSHHRAAEHLGAHG